MRERELTLVSFSAFKASLGGRPFEGEGRGNDEAG